MKSFQAEILTPRQVVYSGPAEMLVMKGALGYFGVMAGHAPLLARLAPGKLKLTREGKESIYNSSAGFIHVTAKRASILLDEVKVISGL